eukprot:5240669-Karenia_brevis.AAC.1
MPLSSLPPIPAVAGEERRWLDEEALAAFTNDIFLDGSGNNYFWLPSLDRAGWGAAQVDHGRLVGAMYGTLPGREQTVPRAELYALRAVLPWVIPPATIWMDHINHVRAIRKGRAWCTSPYRPHADLWRTVWNLIDDIGGLGGHLRIEYTPAHAKASSVESVEARNRRIGNSWADRVAKQGRDLHVPPGPLVQECRNMYNVALCYSRWVGT